jgi:hypothetical protein
MKDIKNKTKNGTVPAQSAASLSAAAAAAAAATPEQPGQGDASKGEEVGVRDGSCETSDDADARAEKELEMAQLEASMRQAAVLDKVLITLRKCVCSTTTCCVICLNNSKRK